MVCPKQSVIDRIHLQRHLAKSDYVRSQLSGTAAGRAGYLDAQVFVPWHCPTTDWATGFEQFTVHMDDPLRAHPLVKVVDVLGTQKQAAAALGQTGLQVSKRPVTGVGLC
jgi:hypothetical protein